MAALDLDAYREAAEAFVSEIDREYYLQGAGHKAELELGPIYARHEWLFDVASVAELRDAVAAAAIGDAKRASRYLLAFALDGFLGRATSGESEEAARLEATLEVETAWGATPYRQVPAVQANEPDRDRRAELEAARDALMVDRLNPISLSALARSHELCRELGWASYAHAYADARGIDLEGLARQTDAFLKATEGRYANVVNPSLEAAGLPPLGEVRRSDLARYFRAPDLDAGFPAQGLLDALERTLAGLGIDIRAQPNVRLDTEPRPTKSPRAFCAPVRVPDEIYLVIAPIGGREDYAALFHEAGHTEHYAHVSESLAFEFCHLGDNSVTESFAFLLEHLTEDPVWLGDVLGVEDPAAIVDHARASRLVFLRRYAAKLTYELELHGGEPALEGMPGRYAELLGEATRVAWPTAPWLADVDPGFYVACYLRAWALETYWRRHLRERWGDRWYSEAEAGVWLRALWRDGQRLGADELVAESLGEELDFLVLAREASPSAG